MFLTILHGALVSFWACPIHLPRDVSPLPGPSSHNTPSWGSSAFFASPQFWKDKGQAVYCPDILNNCTVLHVGQPQYSTLSVRKQLTKLPRRTSALMLHHDVCTPFAAGGIAHTALVNGPSASPSWHDWHLELCKLFASGVCGGLASTSDVSSIPFLKCSNQKRLQMLPMSKGGSASSQVGDHCAMMDSELSTWRGFKVYLSQWSH